MTDYPKTDVNFESIFTAMKVIHWLRLQGKCILRTVDIARYMVIKFLILLLSVFTL